jgi:hypothetical protein
MIEDYGLKTEARYVPKLGCAKIIPTVEQKISGRTKWIRGKRDYFG